MVTNLARTERITVPTWGQVGAGTVVPFSNGQKKVVIYRPRSMKEKDSIISIEVCGNSLINDGIHDGDRLTCKTNFESFEIWSGRLVVVELPCRSLVVKHIYQMPNGMIKLASANPEYRDTYYDPELIHIKAVVLESVRRWDR